MAQNFCLIALKTLCAAILWSINYYTEIITGAYSLTRKYNRVQTEKV